MISAFHPALDTWKVGRGLVDHVVVLILFILQGEVHTLELGSPALPGKSHGRRSLVGCSPWVAKSRTRLSDFTFTFHFRALEKEMATHSSVLAWGIPGTGEPGGLPSMGVAQCRTRLKRLSSSSSSSKGTQGCPVAYVS